MLSLIHSPDFNRNPYNIYIHCIFNLINNNKNTSHLWPYIFNNFKTPEVHGKIFYFYIRYFSTNIYIAYMLWWSTNPWDVYWPKAFIGAIDREILHNVGEWIFHGKYYLHSNASTRKIIIIFMYHITITIWTKLCNQDHTSNMYCHPNCYIIDL